MEYALTELFERREGRVLTLGAYRELGGCLGSPRTQGRGVARRARRGGQGGRSAVVPAAGRAGRGNRGHRRPVPRSELASLEIDQQAMATVIDTFGASRQLSFDRDPQTGTPTVELAHEAMLTAWPRLHRWIDASRDDLRAQHRLAAAARDWNEADQDPSFLLSGSRLEQAEAWRGGVRSRPDTRGVDLPRRICGRTRPQEDRRGGRSEARERDLERRSVRRLRTVVAVLTVAALVAGVLTVFATNQQGRAEQQERTAIARELAAASVANLDVDPERSILLALEAIDRTRSVDGSVLPEAEEALHQAVTTSRIELTSQGAGGNVDWSPHGDVRDRRAPRTRGPSSYGTR